MKERTGSSATATAATRDEEASTTRKLEVVVRDQNGRYVELAAVSVWSDEGTRTYRGTGTTNYNGRVAFSRVPQNVRVEVRHGNSSHSEGFTVTIGGLSEMRVTIDVGESENPRQRGGPAGGIF